jgi:hypothetical protein
MDDVVETGDELVFEDAASDNYVVETVSEEDPLGGKSPTDLLAELKAKEAELEQVRSSANSTSALTSAFSALGDRLEKAVKPASAPAQQPAQQPGESIDAFKERIRQKFLEDPVGAIAETVDKIYTPIVQQQRSATTTHSKQLMLLDAEKRSIYDKYQGEVEAFASASNGSPTAYQDAVDRVAAAHMGDIVTSRVNAAVEQAVAEALAARGLSAQTPARPHVETAPAKPRERDSSGNRVIRMTEAQRADCRRRQMDEVQYYQLYVEKW